MDEHKKRTYTNFQIFWKFPWRQWSKSSWDEGRYRFFWNLHHKFFDKKKNFETNLIMFRALFWVAQPKQKKIKMIFLRPCWNWILRTNFFFNVFSQNFFKNFFNILFRIFFPHFLNNYIAPLFWIYLKVFSKIFFPTFFSKFFKHFFQNFPGGGQNFERRNVERPIFWNLKITNIKITKDEIYL